MILAAASLLPFPLTLSPHTLFPRHPPQPLPLRLHETVHGFLVSASRRPRTESLISGASDADTELEVDEYYSDEEEEEGEMIPLQEMGRWLRNKPAGFGEGKDYDTAMEEKLLEEIERDRIAQAANIDKLRKESVAPDKKEQQQKKDTVGVPSGTRVRVSNLPRKKNVHRDLRLAFKGFNGITNINPAVMGNRKTRDPICKGFAFVDLQSKEVANRFVQQYSKQSVLFGKMQKLITCSVVSMEPKDEIPENPRIGNHSRISVIPDDQTEEETVLNLNSTDGLSSQIDRTETAIEHANITPRSAAENLSEANADVPSSSDSSPSSQRKGKQVASKKKKVKSNSAKSTGLSLPASMVRLNVKERSVLTGVFSKYGGKAIPELSKKS